MKKTYTHTATRKVITVYKPVYKRDWPVASLQMAEDIRALEILSTILGQLDFDSLGRDRDKVRRNYALVVHTVDQWLNHARKQQRIQLLQ